MQLVPLTPVHRLSYRWKGSSTIRTVEGSPEQLQEYAAAWGIFVSVPPEQDGHFDPAKIEHAAHCVSCDWFEFHVIE